MMSDTRIKKVDSAHSPKGKWARPTSHLDGHDIEADDGWSRSSHIKNLLPHFESPGLPAWPRWQSEDGVNTPHTSLGQTGQRGGETLTS
jgi:hypothetical protein